MEPSSDPSQKQLLNKLRQVVEKSIEANAKYIQNSSELFRQLAERRSDLSDVTGGGWEILNRALTDYMRTSAAYTSQLIDLGVEVTEELGGRLGEKSPNKTGSEESHVQVLDLRMFGLPGTRCQTSFVLDSNRSEPIRVQFNYSMLVDAAGENALDVPIQFNPPVVKLDHLGDKRRVVVVLELPPDINFGLYHTILTVEGMPGLQYRLLVIVEESLPGMAGAAKQKQSPKRTSVKKKKTAAKKRKPLARK